MMRSINDRECISLCISDVLRAQLGKGRAERG